MSTVSLRLPDMLLKEADARAEEMRIPRAEYIRRAIEVMNQTVVKQRRRERMMTASLRVRDESMRVNAEFGAIEREPKT